MTKFTPNRNAYVSGISKELNFDGNGLVQFQTMFVVGNMLGLLPLIYLCPRAPMHYLVPTLEPWVGNIYFDTILSVKLWGNHDISVFGLRL